MKTPLIGMYSQPSVNVAGYAGIMSSLYASAGSLTEADTQTPMPCAGTLSNLNIETTVAPGAGKSWAVAVRLNGATVLSATISGTTPLTAVDASSVSFSAGDLVNIMITPTGTPASFSLLTWNIDCDTLVAGAGFPMLSGTTRPMINSGTHYIGAQGHSFLVWNGTEANTSTIVPCAGTISGLRAHISAVAGASKTWTFTVEKNGSDTALTCAISGATDKTASDLTHSVTVAAGDLLSIKNVPTSSPTASYANFGILFTPTTDGESFHSMLSLTAANGAATNYQNPTNKGASAWSATEANVYSAAPAMTVTGMYLQLGSAPGSGTSYTLTLRKASADTAISTIISGTDTTGHIVGQSVTFTQGQKLSLKSAPATSPATMTSIRAAFIMYNTPPAAAGSKGLLTLGVG